MTNKKQIKHGHDMVMLGLAAFVGVAGAMVVSGTETLFGHLISTQFIAFLEFAMGLGWIGVFVYYARKTYFDLSKSGSYQDNSACKETDDGVYFYTPKHYCLDNFSAFQITIWGEVFAISEHAYQWKKFAVSAPKIASEIVCATSPNAVKKISDAHKAEVASDFDKLAIMEEVLRAKLAQHDKVRRVLAETGEKTTYENSPTDNYWGVGKGGKGQNMLGELWMRLREEIME